MSLASRREPTAGTARLEQESLPDGARPMYFGTPEAPVFGWLHGERHPQHSTGLVLCSPFGNEEICAHRTVRSLAERAAAAGIPTLRFDYQGTGDSAGDDFEAGRLTSWLESIRLAAEELRESAGVEKICFAGIRLGAALAALVSAERTDVAGLIAIAPVVSGRAYVRELRMLARAMDSKRNMTRDAHEEVLETAGFVLTAETQKALGAIDLKALQRAPAPKVLIIDRQELPTAEAWAHNLRAAGVLVGYTAAPGYTEMMLDSHETVIPEQMLGAALDWLGEITRTPPPAGDRRQHGPEVKPEPSSKGRQPRVGRPEATFATDGSADPLTGEVARPMPIRETAVSFGADRSLFGIVSRPREPMRSPQAAHKAILLLNSGAVRHVGPNRLYVHLARHLARLGHTVLRMDIAGIGDSPPRPGQPDNVVYSRSALQDVAEAVELLRGEYHAKQITAVGLCSGAYHAFKAAVARLPVTGVVAINPLTFFWKEGQSLEFPEHRIIADMARYQNNLWSAASWRKLLTGRVHLLELAQVLTRRAGVVLSRPLVAGARLLGAPLKDDLATELRRFVQHSIDLQFIFAANDPGFELLHQQGGAFVTRMRARGQLRLETIANADHTFTDLAPRAALARLLVQSLATAQTACERQPLEAGH